MRKVVLRPKKRMYIFVDESGCVNANQAFIAGAWFTWRPDLWEDIIFTLRKHQNFWREMHFHRISRKPNDSQFEMIQALIKNLRKFKRTWYARLLYVSEKDHLEQWRDLTSVDLYDNLMIRLLNKFGGHFPEKEAVIYLDEKNRPRWDDYIPNGLEEYLNNNIGLKTGTNVIIKTSHCSENNLLQVSDIITSATRQMFVPSGNENKQILAASLINVFDRIKIWNGQ